MLADWLQETQAEQAAVQESLGALEQQDTTFHEKLEKNDWGQDDKREKVAMARLLTDGIRQEERRRARIQRRIERLERQKATFLENIQTQMREGGEEENTLIQG
jgi:hypothetical protein